MGTSKHIKGSDYSFPYDIPKHFVVSVQDRRPSAYMQDASGETGGDAIAVDTARAKMLKRISSVMVYNEKTGVWEAKRTRFIRGVPTIWVEEQDAKYKDAVAANPAQNAIWLEFGDLTFASQGNDLYKAMFLMLHENNGSFVGDNRFKRPDGALDQFFVIDTERDAEDIVDDFDHEIKAKAYLARLKRVDKNNETVYRTDLLEHLASVFKIAKPESGVYGSEVFVQLMALVNADPKRFMQSIGDAEGIIEEDLRKAISAGVIGFDEMGVVIVPTSKVILSFKKELSRSEQIESTLDFLCNPKNRGLYDQVRNLTYEVAKKSLAVQTEEAD